MESGLIIALLWFLSANLVEDLSNLKALPVEVPQPAIPCSSSIVSSLFVIGLDWLNNVRIGQGYLPFITNNRN